MKQRLARRPARLHRGGDAAGQRSGRAAAFVMLWWLIVWAMDRRGVHLKL
jgi:hypothetical protein